MIYCRTTILGDPMFWAFSVSKKIWNFRNVITFFLVDRLTWKFACELIFAYIFIWLRLRGFFVIIFVFSDMMTPKKWPIGCRPSTFPVPPQKNRERHAKDLPKSWRPHPRMTSGTFFQWEKNLSKGVQATQTGGPPGFPMLPPRGDSEGECFAPPCHVINSPS